MPRHTAQQHGAAVDDREQRPSGRSKSLIVILGAVLLVGVCYALLNAS
jgi:hypothetical protein